MPLPRRPLMRRQIFYVGKTEIFLHDFQPMAADKQKSWTAITYAQDFSDEGAGLGPQTILRLQRIVDARNEGYNIKAVVLAGGIGPEKELYPMQTKPFANMMG